MTDHCDDETLRRFKGGWLTGDHAELVEQHMEECDECGSRFDELEISSDPLMSALASALGKQVEPTLTHDREPSSPATENSLGDQPKWSGRRLMHFEMGECLGAGAMGIVYQALDTRVGRQVALKVISPQREWRPDDRVRFKREAKAAAHLQHANIIQIFEFGEHEGTLYCAFEFVDNGTLAEQLCDQPMSQRDAARMVAILADAVHYAHRRNVIHRDLKPANILLTKNLTPKIADFGLAKRLDDSESRTLEGIPVGTPSYMSPEQALGITNLTTATDIYSLGAILYECLVGKAVFEGGVISVLDQVKNAEPDRPRKLNRNIDRDLEAICLRCLNKNPARRFETAADLSGELRSVLAGVPIRSRSPSFAERGWKLVKRNPIAAAFCALFILSLIIALPVVTSQNWQLEERAAELSSALEFSQRTSYALQLQRATELASSDPFQATSLLLDEQVCKPELREFYWRLIRDYATPQAKTFQDISDVTAIDYSESLSLAAFGTTDGKLIVADLEDVDNATFIQAHSDSVTSVHFADDQKTLVTTGSDAFLKRWDIESLVERQGLVVPGADGREAGLNAWVELPDGRMATGHSGGKLVLWSPGGDILQEVNQHETGRSIIGMDRSSDGALIVASFVPMGDPGNGKSVEGAMVVYRATDLKPMMVAKGVAATNIAFHPHRPGQFYSTSLRREVQGWTIKNNSLQRHRETFIGDFRELGSALAISPSGQLLAGGSYDSTVKIWSTSTEKRLLSLQFAAPVQALDFVNERDLLVGIKGQGAKKIRIGTDLAPRIKTYSKKKDERAFESMQFDAVSGFVVAGTQDGSVLRFNPQTMKVERCWQSPSNRPMDAMGVDDQGNLVWSSDSAVYRCPLGGDFQSDHQVVMLGMEAKAVVPTRHGIVLATRDFRTMLISNDDGTPLWDIEMDVVSAHYSFASDRLLLLVEDPVQPGRIQVWIGDARTGHGAVVPGTYAQRLLAISHDGTRFCISTIQKEICHYTIEGELLSKTAIPEQNAAIRAITYSADDRTLAVADNGGRVTFWDTQSKKTMVQLGRLQAGGGGAYCAVFARTEGDCLVIGCKDKTFRIFGPVPSGPVPSSPVLSSEVGH